MTKTVPTKLRFFTQTQDAWEAMYEDCLQAEQSITFEQYLLADDRVGNRFLKLFRDKAKSGVNVHLLLDAYGSMGVRSSKLLKEVRNAGGKVRFYNNLRPWHLFKPSRWFPRSHCKTMLIDSKIAYTGGVCMAAFMQHWHDLHVRITGDLVNNIKIGPRKSKDQSPETDGGKFQYVAKFSKFGTNPIYKKLLEAINGAKKDVYLVSPYFFPPRRLRKALRLAARRGVRVRIMISEKTDIPFTTYLARSYFRSLIRKGVEIMIFNKAVLHAKYAIVDDHWATMGSTNWDYLSLFYNREANIVIKDTERVAEMKTIFENEMALCRSPVIRQPLWMRLLWPLIKHFRKAL